MKFLIYLNLMNLTGELAVYIAICKCRHSYIVVSWFEVCTLEMSVTEGSRAEYRAITIYHIVPCNFKSYHVIDLLPQGKLNLVLCFIAS